MSKKQKVKKIKIGKIERREARVGYLFISPWLIGVIIFLSISLIIAFIKRIIFLALFLFFFIVISLALFIF